MTQKTALSYNTMQVLKKRYLLKDDKRRVVETPEGLFRRAASCVARAEKNFKGKSSAAIMEEKFFDMMSRLEFLPNSPTLMNAGTSLGQLSACFVLPVADSIDDIFGSVAEMARIHQTGGGTGFSFSHLRPKGDLVYSTKGEASGPVSFMSIFDRATGVIVQGGRRRGANMGTLRCNHPDIVEFVNAKAKEGDFSNFNLSVGCTDKFIEAVRKDKKYDLINPRTRKKTASVKARDVFGLAALNAWKNGDPGLVFLDEINRKHPMKGLGQIETTNPCGELPLLPYESCNLASINLKKMVKGAAVDWDKLKKTIEYGIRFLDDVIEVNKFPMPEIEKMTVANRKIGLGVMGFADMLIILGLSYNSWEAVELARNLMRFVRKHSLAASSRLARERGVFKNHKRSVYARKGLRLRNATVNTIAPTGTISMIAGCSSSIEPLFAVSFMRNVLSGQGLFEVNPLFEQAARKRGFYSKGLMEEVAQKGTLAGIKGVPADIKRIFACAFDVSTLQHLKIQAAFQGSCDNSVSKTINLPRNAKIKDVRDIYLKAHELGCKGITVYRDGTKKGQVLSLGRRRQERFVTAEPEYAGGCMAGVCGF